ncbi:hypothetical protein [Thermoactinospora rubra]|uniref:hypothetical protein n=1 Tax=Thermoactinospora rubra TaxID=1088767 RepID=UPI000A10667E|nr:hypothetical protein [Thermoactinospora rubra]
MTHRARALRIGLVWGLAVTTVLVAVPLALRERLPEPLATHWSGRPDGSMPLALFLALSAGLWLPAWGILLAALLRGRVLDHRSGRAQWWGLLAGIGVLPAGMSLVTLLANLDATSWREAAPLGPEFLVPVVAAVAAGAAAGYLGRGAPDVPREPGHAPPGLPLSPDRRVVWVSRVRNRLLLALSRTGMAAGAVVAALSLVMELPGPAASIAWWSLPLWLAGYATATVRVRVTAQGVAIGFGPLGWPARRIPMARIERARVEERFPAQVGGYGLRGLPGSATVMVRGGECLVLDYRSGGRLAISVDDAERGASLVNALVGVRA